MYVGGQGEGKVAGVKGHRLAEGADHEDAGCRGAKDAGVQGAWGQEGCKSTARRQDGTGRMRTGRQALTYFRQELAGRLHRSGG